MNNLLNKFKELLANDKVAKVKNFALKYKNYIGVCVLFIVMVLVLYFATGEDAIAKRLDRINNKTVSGEDYVPDKEFAVDAYPELNDLINTYFDAYVNADFEVLEGLATPVSDMEKSYITVMSQYYESYENVVCYSKHGLSKNSYIVSACFDIKFKDQETMAPSMVLFYVQTNADGGLYINNLYSDFNMKYSETPVNSDVYTALRKYTTQADYLELYNKVEKAFASLIKENNEIYQLTKRTIPSVRQEWEDTVFYAPSPEDTEDETGTEVQKSELYELAQQYKDVTYVSTGKNLGFGGGHNYILEMLESKYHAIVNPDIILEEDAFSELISFMDDESIGMCVPRLVDEEGNLLGVYRRELTVWDMFIRMFLKGAFKKRQAYHTMQDMDYTKVFDVPFAQGSFLLIRTELFKQLKGFDERFFLYMEDVDLCKRLNQISRLCYCPHATVIHKWEKGSHKNGKLFKLHVQSMISYFCKWGWR